MTTFPDIVNRIVCIDTETTGIRWTHEKVFSFALTVEGQEPLYYDIRKTPSAVYWLQDQLPRVKLWVNHALKFDVLHMMNLGVKVNMGRLSCTMLRAALIDEHLLTYDLDSLAKKYIGMEKMTDIYPKLAAIFGGRPTRNAQMPNLPNAPSELVAEYAKRDALVAYKLWEWQEGEIERQGLHKVVKLEHDLLPVVIRMERRGIRIDMERAERSADEIDVIVKNAKIELDKMAGFEVNYNPSGSIKKLFEPKMVDGKWVLNDGTVAESTEAGAASIDADCLRRMKHPAAAKILRLRKLTKAADTFLRGHVLGHAYKGRVHCNINQTRGQNDAGTGTGRLCIAEGQRVLTPRGEIPIQDIIIGEYVYCYDDTRKLRLKRVTDKFYTGFKDCVELKWVSSSRTRGNNTGSITCTPQHPIRLKTGEYVQAQDIRGPVKVLHARRRQYLSGASESPRIRVYSTDRSCEPEQAIIKRDVFGVSDTDAAKYHVHHKNELTTDNDIINLELMTASSHTSMHALAMWADPLKREKMYQHWDQVRVAAPVLHGVLNASYKMIGKTTLFKAISRGKGTVKGAAAFLGVDRGTIRDKFREWGVPVDRVLLRYDGNGEYISKGRLLRALEHNRKNKFDVAKRLNIGHAKVDRLCASHECERNHQIYPGRPVGKRHVWDLSIEGEHNFIVEEICVHNSINDPALQQIPARDKEMKRIVRPCFLPDEGQEWVGLDWSQIDFRMMAHYTKIPSILQTFHDNPKSDFHQIVADMTGLPRSPRFAGDASSKMLNLALSFGMGPGKMAAEMGLPFTIEEGRNGKTYTKPGVEAEEVFRKYHTAVPGIKEFLDNASSVAKQRGYIVSIMGRHLRFPGGQFLHKAGGFLFQSACAEAMKVKMIEFDKFCLEQGGSMLLTVHDELGLSMPAGRDNSDAQRLFTRFDGIDTPIKFRVPIESDMWVQPNWYEP